MLIFNVQNYESTLSYSDLVVDWTHSDLFWIKLIEEILVQCISASVDPGEIMKLLNSNFQLRMSLFGR